MLYFPTASRSPLFKLLVVLFILAIATSTALPNYFTGNWVWRRVPQLEHVKALKAIQTGGLALPGWQTLEQGKVEIGGHKWSVQAISPSYPQGVAPKAFSAADQATTLRTASVLMLRPQTWQRDMPQVDWVDVDGAQRWTADSIQSLQFTAPDMQGKPMEIDSRFLRGWSEKQTYAVLQWYAWKTGGSSAPAAWFWTDQLSQIRDRRRTSWVAVSILIPIPPLSNINAVQSQAETLAKLVQSTLTSRAL
jgi:cyanoexosortase B-associated protein